MTLQRIAASLLAFASLLVADPLRADEAKFVELTVYPANAALNHADDYQAVVAVAKRDDGISIDVTNQVEWQLDTAGDIAAFAESTLHPLANGAGQLRAKLGDLHASCQVTVSNVETTNPVSYRHDVIPVLVRAGCNSGACHGSARGKDGFMLSLFGFDPKADYDRLTRELSTRRINRALPDDSLLLVKAVGGVPHTGGKLFDHDTVYYGKLRSWIEQGVPNDLEGAPTVESVEFYPPRIVLEGTGTTQQFVAIANYSDGSTRDVTNLAVFSSNNDSVAKLDGAGIATSGARGEAFVMARFDTHTVGSQVIVLPDGLDYQAPETQPANYIDELVDSKLTDLRILPSETCSDAEFLRRLSIDTIGMLPTPEEVEQFVNDRTPDKRAKKIEELVARDEFSEIWALKLAELLMVRSEVNRVDYKAMFLYSQWLKKQIDDGVPLDQMVKDLLSASGSTFDTPQTNFYQIEPDTNKISENVAQSFLGIRMQCAQCHNHPFDRWTMDDYYGFTAFFSQINRKRGSDYREWMIYNRGAGEVNHPVSGQQVAPKFLGGEAPDTKGRDRREIMAEWVTSEENPWFAPNIANRVWAHFMGVGVVEPVDDFRVSNPASNPALLASLGDHLIDYRYDLRQLVRDICNSNAYQRSTVTNESNETDLRNFAHAVPRRLPAETLLDCVCQVTENPEKLPGLPLGSRAVEIADGRSGTYFLTTFGRAKRESVCACEVQTDPTLSQALHMLNGNTVHAKVQQGNLVGRMLDSGSTVDEVLDAIYLRCLARKPTEEERQQIAQIVGDTQKPKAELEDVFWAVLNSREFLFNH
ncbi:hypothetical protein Pan181_43450 [Aeoliella mucimassa]|uniref:BIG2 domain-containing protein n=2 Tax=Aeoliella mucimassa TaxID=2527972 RepID=A0A518ATR8_9BACT|nr:hypothetical protein Pan181_43450 [Aeoliella mucimassa]